MLDTTQRKPDYFLLTVVGILVPFGLVMVYSASFMDALTTHDGNQNFYAWRQVTAAIIGSVVLLVTQRIDYRFWRRFSVPFMILTLGLLVLVLILPSSITTVNGAKSWIRLGPLSFQPSEMTKLAMIIYFADWLSRRSEKLGNATFGLIPFAVTLGIVCGLVMLEHDLGTTIVLAMIGVAVYFAAGANVLHIIGAGLLSGGAFWAMVKGASYRQERIQVWLEGPFAYYQGAGYQPAHALYALASGGYFGVGLGQGRQKFLWLPQAFTDAIFAIIGEEFGLLGTVFVVGAFLLIAFRGFRIAARSNDPFAALLATGLTSWLVFQGLINIAVVTTLIPFTGLTLPFLSYGGTSLIMCMAAVGILLSLSRHTADQDEGDSSDVAQPSRRIDRATTADVLALRWRNWRARLPRVGSGRGVTGRAGSRRWNSPPRSRNARFR